ncbi:MAG: Gfo/Idh/MocA family oxidoreductase [Bacteroidota bacterium]
MSTTPIRWGILATGNIARKFALGLAELPDAELVAVGSRRQAAAEAFGAEFNVAHCHGSYEELAANPEVDAIYVATPHPYHLDNALLCLEHGKAVLCEKPMAVNALEVEQMVAKAREKQVFLMEAMWTRHLPVWRAIRTWLAEGLIGDIRLLTAEFSFLSSTRDPADRKFNPALAGGALLDVGIYPVALAYDLFRADPEAVRSLHQAFSTGVDEQSAYLFRYPNGAMAVLSSGFAAHGAKEAVIAGTKGTIRIPLFWKAQEVIVELTDQAPVRHEFPYAATGLQHQAVSMMAALRAGKLECEEMSWEMSLQLARMMDRLRTEWGLVYPGE